MRNLKFKYAAAWNFLPFGPEGIELHFDNYKNIILIRGENRDAKLIDASLPSDDFKGSSNGSGKSSTPEIIVYGLYGKTIKRPDKLNANDVIHNKANKDCKVEVIFDDYRIVRTRMENGRKDKNSLRLWQSKEGIWDKNTEITQGTMPLTQKKIEQIIGLSYEAFVNICIFTDDQRACFLECDNKQKKEIVENMLSLGDYRDWFETAKNLRKEIKGKIDMKAKEYQLLLSNQDDAKRRLSLTEEKETKWFTQKKIDLEDLLKNIESVKKSLSSTDNGAAIVAYEEAQEKIKEINEKIPALEESKTDLELKLNKAKEKDSELKAEASKLQESYTEISRSAKSKVEERKKKESEISDLSSNVPGNRCNKCRGIIEEENISDYIAGLNREINDINLDIQALVLSSKNVAVEVEELKKRQTKVKEIIEAIVKKISSIDSELRTLRNDFAAASKVREPKADSAELLLQQKIEQLNSQVEAKEKEINGQSPYFDILENDKLELSKIKLAVENKEVEAKELESELPYYDYWISGFGDHGIRKWVVDGIIPELNNRINYWLQFLIDNKITLKFNNELSETIERNPVDGDPYVYHAMSTGQRRRLNLAVSQSFAHIMSLSSGAIPSVAFLDEVTTNIDVLGTVGIYKMICELAEEKQVFVTTHDQELLRMLEGCEVIDLVHENGYTKMV